MGRTSFTRIHQRLDAIEDALAPPKITRFYWDFTGGEPLAPDEEYVLIERSKDPTSMWFGIVDKRKKKI